MTLAYNKNDRGNNMNNNQQVVNFSVEIELVDNKANFTYYIGDDQVSKASYLAAQQSLATVLMTSFT